MPKQPSKKLRASDLVTFDLAAAGHDGVLSDESGSVIVKPCTAREVAFYETALQHPGFARWMPTFFGTLNLSGQGEGQGEGAAAAAAVTAAATAATAAVVDGKPAHDRLSSLVLQNAAYGFEKPCVLDVKLGARLWDDDAPQQKRARLDAVSDQTTSRSLGMRVAGMKVWKGAGAGHRTYDKLYGRSFTADSVGDALGEFFASEISADQTALVAARFLEKVRMVRQQLESQESRMYSASLLFVYEGDGKALARAVEARKAKDEQRDGHHDGDDGDDDDGGDDNDEDGDGDGVSDDGESGGLIAELKLIDFAHASWTPGLGPDENALQGVRSMEKLLAELVG